MTLPGDPIVAIATPPGRGAIGIVRLSGADLRPLARGLLGRVPPPRRARLMGFKDADGTVLDEGIALFFPAPSSFTGEDVLELQGHGGPVVLRMVLERACAMGARPARPGEFTERAFLNDRMDLVQAEAVADLIDSASRRAARSALRSLDGAFSRRVVAVDELLLAARVHAEAAMDFADEDIDPLADEQLRTRLGAIEASLAALLADGRQGRVLREGLDVVIAGAPNVGKSSIMNRLLAEDRAIVTEVPGTTRDVLAADVEIDGVAVRLSDTAGLRPGDDPVERIGVERAKRAIDNADLVLAVQEETGPAVPIEGAAERLVVKNKVDLSGRPAGRNAAGELLISARTGAGFEVLRAAIAAAAGSSAGEGVYLARQRHLTALEAANGRVADAAGRLKEGLGDLAAEDLRRAQERLGEVLGATTSEDLLGAIFSAFCIGK